MKLLRQERYTQKSKYFIKEMELTDYRVDNCSFRRAKTLAKGLFCKGYPRKKHPKWVGYETRANYNRKHRKFYLTTNKMLSRIEREQT